MTRSTRPSKRDLWAAHMLYASGQDDQERLQRAVDELGIKPPRQQRATKPRREREGGIQDGVLQMLRLHPRVQFAVRLNAGAYKTDDGRFIRFGFVGCPDLWAMLKGGRLCCLEVKQPGQKATEAQAVFLDMVRAGGGVAAVVSSVDMAAAVLAEQGAWHE